MTSDMDRALEVKDQLLERGAKLLEEGTEYVKQHPYKSVGIAVAAGFIAMRLLRRAL
jgi:ElaB/YqjD/DUF883 family membrane-anchored ribosome-binding protein